MEDPAIEALEAAAEEFDDLRVQRQTLKAKLIELMKENGKTKYVHGGIEIKLSHGQESLSVHVAKEKPKSEAAA